MVYIDDLPFAKDMSWIDGITRKSDETIIYITICGPYHADLLEAMDCLYLDDKRQFELIQMKTENRYIGACISMKPKYLDNKKENGGKNEPMAGACQGRDAEASRQEA